MTQNMSSVQIEADARTVVVFDLDDTLYPEVDFVRSAYQHIARTVAPRAADELAEWMWRGFCNGEDVFGGLVQRERLSLDVPALVALYRYHAPSIRLAPGALARLSELKAAGARLGVITDGRTVTQSNKLAALGVLPLLDMLVISEAFGSEKPSPANYEVFERAYPGARYYYVGDNFAKDFIVPNRLGWQTIGLVDAGHNIHPQAGDWPEGHLPRARITSFDDLRVVSTQPSGTPCIASSSA